MYSVFNIKKIITVTILLCFSCNFCLAFGGKSNSSTRISTGIADFRSEYINLEWWNNFDDPQMKSYIVQAVNKNNDVRIATLKTEEFNQFVRTSFGEELPHFGILGIYTGYHLPRVFDLSGVPIPSTSNNFFATPLTMSYEADLFLKNRGKTKALKNQYQSVKFQEKAAYISLASTVATVYLNIVKMDKYISLQSDFVALRKGIYERTKNKHKYGVASYVELNNAENAYLNSKIILEDLCKKRKLLLTQFAVLIGESPNNIACIKRIDYNNLKFRGCIPSAIDSEIVFQRPDVQSAEFMMKKAEIDIKTARKEFLPSFKITGVAGWATTSKVGQYFSWDSLLAFIIANISQTIFSGGIKTANLKIQKNRYEQMFETYKKTDLTAMQEINDSLSQIKHDDRIFRENYDKHIKEQDNFRRARHSFVSGVISYPDLLEANQPVLQSDRDKVDAKTQLFVDYISLYKAVGGKF